MSYVKNACSQCGRDTKNHSGLCAKCCSRDATDAYLDRRSNNRWRTMAMELADMMERDLEHGWPYDDEE